jgi:hypothetical protein
MDLIDTVYHEGAEPAYTTMVTWLIKQLQLNSKEQSLAFAGLKLKGIACIRQEDADKEKNDATIFA